MSIAIWSEREKSLKACVIEKMIRHWNNDLWRKAELERERERKREKERKKKKKRERERGWDKKESVIDEKNHLKEGKKLTESEANIDQNFLKELRFKNPTLDQVKTEMWYT